MRHGCIYSLHDPISGELRYYGQTTKNTIEERLASHLVPSSLRKHSYLGRWLLGITSRGQKPEIRHVANAHSQPELDQMEIDIIARGRAEGLRLVNMNDGGAGCHGRPVSQETREKMSASQLGHPGYAHTDEWKALMSAKMSGRNTNSPEHMARLHAAQIGVPLPQATKDKISATKTGVSPDPRTVAKIADKLRGRKRDPSIFNRGQKHHNWRPEVDTNEIVKLANGGLSQREISEKLGIAQSVVQYRLVAARKEQAHAP